MRIYEGKYLSVTSIIDLRKPFDKRSFEVWCSKMGLDPELLSKNSSLLGEKVSRWLEDKANNLEELSDPPVDILEQRLKDGVELFAKDWDVKEAEVMVTCKELNYAGKLDGIVENRKTGKTFFMDWKTYGAYKDTPYKRDASKIKKCAWQLSLYKYAHEGDFDMAVVIFKNDGSYTIEELQFSDDMISWVVDNQELILRTIKID